MNRVLVLMLSMVGVFALAVLPELHARTINCVPDQGCAKGEGPPSCCVPPPCEVMQELKMAQARVNAIEANMTIFPPSWDGPGLKEQWGLKNYQDFEKLMDEASPCPENRFYEPAPLLSVAEEKQCDIFYFEDFDKTYGSASLEDMLDGSNSCTELVEAEYKKAQQQRQICLTEHTRSTPSTLQERMLQDLEIEKAKRDSLLQDIERYKSACSVVPDSTDAVQAVEDDLAALDPSADKPKSKPNKKKAKRFGKKAGRK